MSGFLFCGIKLEPVANASLNSRKPNSVVLQMIKSSLKRDRCKPISARQKRNSHTKSRSPTASRLFWLTRKTEFACDAVPIESDGGASQGAGAKWKNIGSGQAITKALSIAFKSFDLTEQVMRESDRLGTLQMCVTG